MEQNLNYSKTGSKVSLSLRGKWRLERLGSVSKELEKVDFSGVKEFSLNGSELSQIDTSGAMVLLSALNQATKSSSEETKINFVDFEANHLELISLVQSSIEEPFSINRPRDQGLIGRLGKASVGSCSKTLDLLSFIGQVCKYFWDAVKNPKLFRVKELVGQLELVLVDAIPVVTLVTFLIGVVMAYLFAAQIQQYGANIFIVDSVGLAMCRELSPILVAIVMAGRSGSAFTAQLGTMKLNEETDALSTLGMSPMHSLVLPRILALVIAMPLLVMLGDIVGVFGGMLVADFQLGISFQTFLDRLRIVLPINSFCVGLSKAPVFAIFIAIIGCRMGLVVENNARSVGVNTTSTVVQSIVSVILINAAFAVLYVQLGV